MTNYFRAFHYLRTLNRRAYWSRKKLRNYQNKKLRNIVEYAYDYVPFYHKKIREARIKPVDIKTVEDLNKMPIITKDEIKKNLYETISTEFEILNLRRLRTSGSTGEPLYFYITSREDEFRKAKHLRANIYCGQKPLDRWVTIVSPIYFGQTARLQRMLRIYIPKPISVFEDVTNQISILKEFKPDILDGYSSSLLSLAKEVEKRDINAIRPKFLLGGAELIDGSSRKFIEKVFNAPFYDQYGCAELERLASQCPEKVGYHMDADSVVMQFVDENGEEVADGERGEIVCTSLFNYAMPFIRYAVGDIGMAFDETSCPCGRKLPLMKVVEGRKNSLLTLPNGRVLAPFAVIAALMMSGSYEYIDQFRFIQSKKDLLRLQIKRKRNVSSQGDLEKALVAHLLNVLNLNANEITLLIEFVEEIPLDKSGKLMIVVSELNN